MGSIGLEWSLREAETGVGRRIVLPDTGAVRDTLVEDEAVEEGERELRRSCWGRSGPEDGKMLSRRELCIFGEG
jgi:hypothetical protein